MLKDILKQYEKEFAGLKINQIRRLMRERGFKVRHSTGYAFIHKDLDYVIKLAYLVNDGKPRKAAKTVFSKRIKFLSQAYEMHGCSIELVIQEKCNCSPKASKKAFAALADQKDWQDDAFCNCGLDKSGNAVIIDW